ncbi:uracil-DNA glycosylase [Desulfuromonas versatilis]|uniref:Type-5 uracil-DNA glycosylase n=1 Tax=Desulfuromonas versatilis TaxID=2802975 RepID=A0ABM8HQJ4_9BACT|nr:uracil-DNA glycosylase [Desulfuromonas versatilis]BCR04079.1 uracil-DNA glycosylase [Desulfuromonas versatilis]
MLGADLPGLRDCRKCSRLAEYIAKLPPTGGRTREAYWNAPVPGFGDPAARVCLVGLAPGAHGANRTGRPFTGDGAGDFMYPLLHRAGFASQAQATHAGDGLELRDLYITNAVKCVPPENRPRPDEFETCRPFLQQELAALENLRVVVALGQGAFTSYLRRLKQQGQIRRLAELPFAHGAVYRPAAGPWLVASYHTSRYNVQTGRITEPMFLDLLNRVRQLARGENG